MTPRVRRLAGAVAVLIALLLAGRWTASFVAERSWAATISPSAASFVSRWQLLGVALEAGAIVAASLWFAIQALLVARVIASVQVTRRFGDLQLREAIPTRLLLAGAASAGILLGLVAGAGAHAWREPIALAWQGVTYGVKDPLLNRDLGVFVAQLPVWDLGHRFVEILALLGLAFCTALYVGIGAVQREHGAVVIHPDARQHLGVLLAFVALVIGAGYLLAPYHLAASAPTALRVNAAIRLRSTQIMAGVALATGLLSMVWALRGRNGLLVATWIVLGVGALGERFLIPALNDDLAPSPSAVATARRFDAIAWGIRQSGVPTQSDSAPQVTALWDPDMLGRMAERAGSVMAGATPGTVVVAGQSLPVWFVGTLAAADPARLDVLAIADGVTGSSGAPMLIRSNEDARSARPVWRTIADPRTRPGPPRWRAASGGVPSGGPLRRWLFAWARQAPGMLRDPPEGGFDWHLDPTERAAAVVPMLAWTPADLIMVNTRPTWLVQGLLTVDQFPLATRAAWAGKQVAGAAPVLLCTVDVASGETHFYVDPAADSLGIAWARLLGPVIAERGVLPPMVRSSVTYPEAWFESQLAVLEGPTWHAGRLPTQFDAPLAPAPVWVTGHVPGRQMVFEDTHGEAVTLATAYRVDGMPQLRLDRRESDGTAAESRAQLRQLWSRTPIMTHLQDSIAAAGDSIALRSIRWSVGRGAITAWRPTFALPRQDGPVLLWITTAVGDRVGGGHSPAEAWAAAMAPGGAVAEHAPDAATALAAARQWLQQADAAFRRGDMTAFGRAYEELRKALGERP